MTLTYVNFHISVEGECRTLDSPSSETIQIRTLTATHHRHILYYPFKEMKLNYRNRLSMDLRVFILVLHPIFCLSKSCVPFSCSYSSSACHKHNPVPFDVWGHSWHDPWLYLWVLLSPLPTLIPIQTLLVFLLLLEHVRNSDSWSLEWQFPF